MFENLRKPQSRFKSEAGILADKLAKGEDIYDKTPKSKISNSFAFDQPIPNSDGKNSNNPNGLQLEAEPSSGLLANKNGRKRKINEIDDYFDRVREDYTFLIATHQDDINRMQQTCLADSKLKDTADLSSDDCVENATVF